VTVVFETARRTSVNVPLTCPPPTD
jgi:hypothetical protein